MCIERIKYYLYKYGLISDNRNFPSDETRAFVLRYENTNKYLLSEERILWVHYVRGRIRNALEKVTDNVD